MRLFTNITPATCPFVTSAGIESAVACFLASKTIPVPANGCEQGGRMSQLHGNPKSASREIALPCRGGARRILPAVSSLRVYVSGSVEGIP